MFIVDLNQVMLSNLHMQLGGHMDNTVIEESIFRHMVLNSLRSYKAKFSSDYGEMVIACDNKNYWRKQVFPYYKASRKKSQEKSGINWTQIFGYISTLKDELSEFFPYRVIEVESAEADDIIATLVLGQMSQKILILSADKDFVQLQKFSGVKQYDPIRKKWMHESQPEHYLFRHILKGDTGDGIPNILSPDNCLVIGERQKPMTEKRMKAYGEIYKQGTMDSLPEDVRRNFYRNKQLIDLTMVPEDIKVKILDQYITQADKKRDKLLPYFMKHKLKNLLENISEF